MDEHRGGAEPHAAVRVDLRAIRDNVAELRARAGAAEVMAVVKGDAYGHGLVPAARAARAGGASWLGTAVLGEALALRAAGFGGRLMAWLSAPGEQWIDAIAADIDVSASAIWTVEEIADAARETGRMARLHLKVDTGLGRSGAPEADWPGLVDAALKAQAEGLVNVVGLWSHFAIADAPRHPTNTAQVAAFSQAVEIAQARGVRPEVRHLANSAATLMLPDTHFDLVRAGLAVYGLSPVPDVAAPADVGLRPAMSVRARLALVKRVPAGHGVSYGHFYVTDRETSLGLIPLGYADGVPRHGSGGDGGPGAPVLAGGRVRRIAGRVCMDQFVVDLGDDDVHAGDEVVLFGDAAAGEPTAQDWAEACRTISYEIVTRFAPRIPRTYVGWEDLR
ncbi:alanine racemase [Phytoactinopolyspora halotolerans]|uniref:Alanine racemase n=1 Tax=Phytoactinopolyspora halotolerans TaxID=1981512 RepID=A0A6L9S585_9ACTN|nr:alanine racemase [Phytoactinopolyspora halotolerans]NEE00153.1 alanine racemase [Phytoactinopolyspora halotolerans]